MTERPVRCAHSPFSLRHSMSLTYCSSNSAKLRYESSGQAKQALAALKKRGGYLGIVYRCSFCQGFHLGQNKNSLERKKS
jgi:hypothetical protein